jgi:hypothetical protein
MPFNQTRRFLLLLPLFMLLGLLQSRQELVRGIIRRSDSQALDPDDQQNDADQGRALLRDHRGWRRFFVARLHQFPGEQIERDCRSQNYYCPSHFRFSFLFLFIEREHSNKNKKYCKGFFAARSRNDKTAFCGLRAAEYARRTRSRPQILFGLTERREIFYNRKNEGQEMKKLFSATILILTLAGCGQVYDREPVGIGYDNDELKLSPCACMRVYNG